MGAASSIAQQSSTTEVVPETFEPVLLIQACGIVVTGHDVTESFCVHPDLQSTVLSEGDGEVHAVASHETKTVSRLCQAWISRLLCHIYIESRSSRCASYSRFYLHTLSNQFSLCLLL